METGNAQQKLTERATTEEYHIIANLRRNSTSSSRDATFSQSCGEVGTLRDELEHEYLNIENSATNDDRNSNNDIADDNKHEQSDDELDFILPSPPTESPEPSKDSNPANKGLDQFKFPQAKSSHDKLDGRLHHPPSTSNSRSEDQEQTDVLEWPRIPNESLKGSRANIFEQPNSLRPLRTRYEPLSDDQNNRTNENINTTSSSVSERDSYTWNLASLHLPSILALNDGGERLLWPAKVCFLISNLSLFDYSEKRLKFKLTPYVDS